MKRNLLRAPLIQSATVLVIVSLLVYLTATSVEGSFWSSLATLFMAIFRLVQLSVGLILSLFFCMVVLTGIFLGCVAMVSRDSAGRMFEQLRDEISDKLLWARSLVIKDVPGKEIPVVMNVTGEKEEMFAMLEGSLDLIREDQTATENNVEWLLDRLDHLEQEEAFEILSARLGKQEEQVLEASAKLDQVRTQMENLQENFKELSDLVKYNKRKLAYEELGARVDALAENIATVQDEMLKSRDISASDKMQKKSVDKDQGESLIPRLFAHIKNKAMQEKIEQLVSETLESDMSYAQVIDHLVKNTSGKTSETIAAHPSLTKEYIRYRRDNG